MDGGARDPVARDLHQRRGAEANTRKTIDERMDQWLNDQADRNDVPDEDREEFIDLLSLTSWAAGERQGFAMDDVREALTPHWLRRILRGKRQG